MSEQNPNPWVVQPDTGKADFLEACRELQEAVEYEGIRNIREEMTPADIRRINELRDRLDSMIAGSNMDALRECGLSPGGNPRGESDCPSSRASGV